MASRQIGSVLVTGSNRGIGLELMEKFLGIASPPEWIFATCRDPDGPRAQELRNLASKHSNLVLLQLETTDLTSVQEAAKKVESTLNGSGLNLLINNAAVISQSTLETSDREDMLHVYDTNVVGPLLVSQAFLPLLKKAAQGSTSGSMSCSRAALINISSTLGSIESVPITFFKQVIPYRTSKAALNMLTACQAEAYKQEGILCVALHPGWVKTDMGTDEAPLTKDTSVKGILNVLCSLSEKHNGTMVDWEGNPVPW